MEIKNKVVLKIGIYIALMLIPIVSFSQNCTTCGTVISTNSGANITLNVGESLCINAGVTYSGNITLNGGTLCNQGTVTNITLNKGVFNNYGVFNKTGALNINNTDKMYINCFGGSTVTITGALNQTSSNATDTFALKLFQGSQFTIGNSINNTKGWLKIRVGSITTNTVYANSTTIFNVNGQFNISNAGLDLINYNHGYVNINKAVSLDNKVNKTILNNGTFNVNNSFNIGGNAQGSGIVTITNNSLFNISDNFNSSYNNGTVTVNNNDILSVGKSFTLSKDDNNIINSLNGVATIGLDITIEHGSFTNNGKVYARDFDTKFGIYTNNNSSYANRDFITSNAQAIINNNGFINITNEFNNKATVNLGVGSYINTKGYFNQNNASIIGPVNVPDTGSFAKIFIHGSSQNNSTINGKIIVYDATLQSNSSNIGFGFDQINNSNKIASTILFAAAVPGPPIGPPVSICALISQLYVLNASATPTIVCAGNSVTLTSQFYQKVTFHIFNITITLLVPTAASYTWAPPASFANPNLQNQIINPSSTTTYTVKVNYSGCIFTKTLTVVVVPNTLVANAGQDRAIILPATTIIGGNPAVLGGALPSASGGSSPYTYSWTPFINLSLNNLVPNPAANPPGTTTYSLIVTDAVGCKAIDDVIVYIQTNKEYVILLKQLDGSYYTPVNNKLYFTIDGEYSTMNLNYTVYNYMRIPQTGLTLNTTTFANGDNRFDLTVGTLPSGYYVLEVENQKKEKLFLRFKK